jgi:hypothetical protein
MPDRLHTQGRMPERVAVPPWQLSLLSPTGGVRPSRIVLGHQDAGAPGEASAPWALAIGLHFATLHWALHVQSPGLKGSLSFVLLCLSVRRSLACFFRSTTRWMKKSWSRRKTRRGSAKSSWLGAASPCCWRRWSPRARHPAVSARGSPTPSFSPGFAVFCRAPAVHARRPCAGRARVVCLHGLPMHVVSDRDPRFAGLF